MLFAHGLMTIATKNGSLSSNSLRYSQDKTHYNRHLLMAKQGCTMGVVSSLKTWYNRTNHIYELISTCK